MPEIRVRIIKYVIATLLITAVISGLNGQSGANSPFSRFGFGDVSEDNLFHLRQMAGISAAYTNPYHINVKNPATLPFLRATSFDIGISANYSKISDEDNNSSIWSGNLEYLSLAFPFRNPLNEAFEREVRDSWIAMNISLMPYSSVNYDISTIETYPEFGQIDRNFKGSGGTYQVMWGTGFRYKNFSIGANIGYLFGKIQHERNIAFLEIPTAYDNNFVGDFSVSGFTWNLGMLYRHVLNQPEVDLSRGILPDALQFGIFGKTNTSFNTNSSSVLRNVFQPSLTQILFDTLSSERDIQGMGTLPAEIGLGVNYYRGTKLMLGMQWMFNQWSAYKNDAFEDQLSDTYKISFGGFYQPDFNSFKYSDRIYYRFGVFYGKDPRSFQGEQMDNLGLSFGLGLPFIYQRKVSHINLGVTIGRRGQSDVLSETYVKLGLSLTFNDDEWFIKRRYN